MKNSVRYNMRIFIISLMCGDAESEKFGNALGSVAMNENVGAIIAILAPTAPINFEVAGNYERFRTHGVSNNFDPVRVIKELKKEARKVPKTLLDYYGCGLCVRRG